MTFEATHPRFWTRFRGLFVQHVVSDPRRLTAFRLFTTFLISFGLLRLLTYGIRYHFLPFKNIETASGLHIHHFVWGIFLLLIVGFLALNLEAQTWHPWLAIPFAIGAALVLDEFALWLRLEDNYWAKEGRLSVDVVVWVAALLGLYYVTARFWAALADDVRKVMRAENRLRRRKA